jgi:hypothetical protein
MSQEEAEAARLYDPARRAEDARRAAHFLSMRLLKDGGPPHVRSMIESALVELLAEVRADERRRVV